MKRFMMMVAVSGMVLGASWGMALAGGGSLPAADGKAVYDYITRTSPYQQWPLWPGKEKFYKGQHPHGALLTTYVSDPAKNTVVSKTGQFPVGSIIVKENYMPDTANLF
jgi:hypothetical protein